MSKEEIFEKITQVLKNQGRALAPHKSRRARKTDEAIRDSHRKLRARTAEMLI